MNTTLFIFVMSALICCALSHMSDKLEAISHDCMADVKVTEKELEDLHSSEEKFNAATPALQCHLKCVMEKLGQFKDGVFDPEKAFKNFKEIPDLAEYGVKDLKDVEKCKNEKGSNDCETAFKIAKCLRMNKAPAK